jgi:hypothetical protein
LELFPTRVYLVDHILYTQVFCTIGVLVIVFGNFEEVTYRGMVSPGFKLGVQIFRSILGSNTDNIYNN